MTAELRQQLAQLESAGLIVPDLLSATPAFQFRHGLIRDAAYASLLRQHRRALHQAAGEVLESACRAQTEGGPGTDLDELAPVLARHFLMADDLLRALAYFRQAGDTAMRRFANAEAAEYYGQALDILARQPAEAYNGELALHLFSRRGRALELATQFEAALLNYARMETVASEHGDRALTLAALMGRATILSTVNIVHDQTAGLALLKRASALAERGTERQRHGRPPGVEPAVEQHHARRRPD